MSANEPSEFAREIARRQKALDDMKAEFDRQNEMMRKMAEDAEKLGLNLNEKPDFDAMSEEDRNFCLDFERQINELTSALQAQAPKKSKAPKIGRRAMI